MRQHSPFKEMRILANVKVPIRDGTRLATTVYLPLEEGRYPVVLIRMAYNRAHLRAAFHARDWCNPQNLEPGRIYEFTIDLQATSTVFKKGHRIRLQVTSSNFPLWARNLNTGEPIATAVNFQSAHQTIYHDAEHPSHLVLPLIPCTPWGAS